MNHPAPLCESRILAALYPFQRRMKPTPAPGERLRVERVLAGARVFLAITSMAAIYLDPTEPTRYTTLAYVLMTLYLLHSVTVQLVLREIGRASCRERV